MMYKRSFGNKLLDPIFEKICDKTINPDTTTPDKLHGVDYHTIIIDEGTDNQKVKKIFDVLSEIFPDPVDEISKFFKEKNLNIKNLKSVEKLYNKIIIRSPIYHDVLVEDALGMDIYSIMFEFEKSNIKFKVPYKSFRNKEKEKR